MENLLAAEQIWCSGGDQLREEKIFYSLNECWFRQKSIHRTCRFVWVQRVSGLRDWMERGVRRATVLGTLFGAYRAGLFYQQSGPDASARSQEINAFFACLHCL